MIELSALLPKFDDRYAAVSIEEVLHLSEAISTAIRSVQDLEEQKQYLTDEQKETPDFLRYETDYRFAVMRHLDRVELFGVDIRPEAQRNLLSDAFVVLNVRYQEGDQAEYVSFGGALDRLTNVESRLLLRGPAGSGKSTLLRWTAITAAKQGSVPYYTELDKVHGIIADRYDSGELIDSKDLIEIQSRPGSWRNRIPFIIPLRSCQDGNLPSPSDLPKFLSTELGTAPTAWVENVLATGRALVLVDGIDEVPLMNRARIQDSLAALIEQYANNYLIATTRPEAVPEGWLAALGFAEATINPMSIHETNRFIKRWHEAVKNELVRRSHPVDSIDRLAASLMDRLRNDAVLAPLSSNPLLCAMICALHQYRSGRLPENLRSTCEALCEMLLHRRELESGLPMSPFPAPWPDLSYAQKRYITQNIAFFLLLEEKSALNTEEALTCVAAALDQLPNRTGSEAPVVLRALIERSGMLREARPRSTESHGMIDFIHNTFKEYLGGERVAARGEAALLADKCQRDPVWKRAALFAASSEVEGFPTTLIRHLRSGAEAKPGFNQLSKTEKRAINVFCLQCRAVAISLDPNLNRELEVLITDLFPPRSLEDGQHLASLGEIAVPFLRLRSAFTELEAASCLRTLRLINNQSARDLIPEYLQDSRLQVVQELALWIDPLRIPALQQLMRTGVKVPDGIRDQVTNLGFLREFVDFDHLNLESCSSIETDTFPVLESVKTLSLSFSGAKDLRWTPAFPNLSSLYLVSTQISDFHSIWHLPKLQTLDLTGCQAIDYRPLAQLKELSQLVANESRLVNLLMLEGMHSLRVLEVKEARLSDLNSARTIASDPESSGKSC
jgi:hypothetical protein